MTDASEAHRGSRRPALAFIFVTALMDVLSLGIIIPVLPNLLKEFAGGDTAAAAIWVGLFGSTWALMQFFFSPILGMISDRFGRRPVILISIFGLGMDYLFMALAPTLAWLFLGRIIHGITAASFATAGAYIADVSPPERRARNFGLIGAAWSVGFVLGPVVGGTLGDIDLRLPFYVAAGLALANWLYGYFVLPESLPPEKREARFVWKKANPLGSLKLLRSHPDLLGLASLWFLYHLAHYVLPAVFVLYTGHRYGWSMTEIGGMLMITGLLGVVVQALLVGPIVKRVGERGALLIGMAAGATGFTIYALAPTEEVYWIGMPIFALMGLVQASIQGLMTRRVAPHEQGQLQGANSSIAGITGLIGPGLYTAVFAWSLRNEATQHMPGLAILVAGGLMALGFFLSLRFAKPAPAAEPQPA
ncbi:MAG TPA: TCR/Tet family MFS transporter [Caulobacteraceae bacterium]|nr:TCR/Tet family MFS transporter [Caulobacteraceae bacterium]